MTTLEQINNKYHLNRVFGYLAVLVAAASLFKLINIILAAILIWVFAISGFLLLNLKDDKSDIDFFNRVKKPVVISIVLSVSLIIAIYFYTTR